MGLDELMVLMYAASTYADRPSFCEYMIPIHNPHACLLPIIPTANFKSAQRIPHVARSSDFLKTPSDASMCDKA